MSDKNILPRYNAIYIELIQLYDKIQNYIKERVAADGYVYSATYRGWIQEYNCVVKKYNDLTGANLSMRQVQEYELSSTQKTVRTDMATAFMQSIKKFSDTVYSEIQAKANKDAPIPAHQMRVCFKTGTRGCPLDPSEKQNRVFVAMSFGDEYRDSYEYGVKLVLEQMGMEYYRADNEISNKDIMCKICKEIQTCGIVIANISGLNPNVMLELGLAYGLGKNVVVIKDKKTTAISDLGSVEYIEYSHAGELQQKLPRVLENY